MAEINRKGFIAGGIAWLVLVGFLPTAADCAKHANCDAGDLFLHSIVTMGMLAPAWLVAVLTSELFAPPHPNREWPEPPHLEEASPTDLSHVGNEEIAILRAFGYPDQEIVDMGTEERAEEVAQARDAGVEPKPAGTT